MRTGEPCLAEGCPGDTGRGQRRAERAATDGKNQPRLLQARWETEFHQPDLGP